MKKSSAQNFTSSACMVVFLSLQVGISFAHEHKHGHGHEQHQHKHHSDKAEAISQGFFEDHDVKDRALSDWEGTWQSVYPYLLSRNFDEVLAMKAQSGDKTVEDYRNYYLKGYKTDLALIRINHDEIEFYASDKFSMCHYQYSGKKILTYQSGNRGVRYLFECQDAQSTSPKYIQFSDHIIAPEKSGHFHIYMGNDSHDALYSEVENWPTFYPANLNSEEIVDEMMGHGTTHGAHQHGVANLNLSVEGKIIDIELQGALANFISFEHAPESEIELAEVKTMVTKINAAEKLFTLPKEAACQLGRVVLSSDIIDGHLLSMQDHAKKETDHAHKSKATHGNLSAHITFTCNHPEKLNKFDVTLFQYFPNLEYLEVQMVTPHKQGAANLSPLDTVIKW